MSGIPIDIAHVALLARIALTEEEKTRFAAQLGKLFEYFRELQELDVGHVPATAQVIP